MRHRTTLSLVPAVLLGSALLAPPMPATPVAAAVPSRYTITDLGSLGTGDLSAATAINNAGVVVGYAHPAPPSPGSRRAPPPASTPPGRSSAAGYTTDISAGTY